MQAALGGLRDDMVHVVPIVVVGPWPLVRPGGIVVDERAMAVGVRIVEAVEFGERYGLDHAVTAGRAILEVAGRLVAVEPVEDLPGGVAEPEEGLPLGCHEKPLVGGNLEPRRVGGTQAGQWETRQERHRRTPDACPPHAVGTCKTATAGRRWHGGEVAYSGDKIVICHRITSRNRRPPLSFAAVKKRGSALGKVCGRELL